MSSMQQSKVIGSAADNERKRKEFRSCNCKRSNCLKLYCECFANAFYCLPGKCNCHNCQNNRENEVHRKAAVEYTLERNPMAFRSKIVGNDTVAKDAASRVQSHHKGCHCKKSNCLKKYCECFQASIVCTERCRCTECKNFTGSEPREKAIQKLKEVNAEFMESVATTDPKNMDPASLAAYYATQTAELYQKLSEKMHDSIQHHPSDISVIGIRDGGAGVSGDTALQALKKQRVSKEFSQCLDAVLDQTEFLYNVGNATVSNYEAAFTVPAAPAPEPAPLIRKPPKYMEPLQSIATTSAMIPPAPMSAENIIRPVGNVLPPPLPSLSQVQPPGLLPMTTANAFGITPIITSTCPHNADDASNVP